MEIDLLYVPDCPNHRIARTHVESALAQTGVAALVREREVRTSEEAARLGMRGSPTILINGADPFGDLAGSADVGFSGAPSVEELIEAPLG